MKSSHSVLMIFAPKFNEFGVDIFKQYLAIHPGAKLYVLHTGLKSECEKVKILLGDSLGGIWLLSDLEAKWISHPSNFYDLSKIDDKYGFGAMGALLTSDRRIGRGFVSGGLCRPDHIGALSTRSPIYFPASYIYSLLSTLESIIGKTAPDLIFCYAVAGSLALALGMISKKNKIPFTRLTHTRLQDYFCVDTDLYGLLKPVEGQYLKELVDPTLSSEFRLEATDIHTKFTQSPSQPEYALSRHKAFKNLNPIRLSLKVLKVISIFVFKFKFNRDARVHVARLLHQSMKEWRTFIFRDSFHRNVPLNQKYIYFPLHVDPEASTMVMAHMHTDQTSVIEALSKSIPSDYILVVKEHLPMIGSRPFGFYRRISRMPRVLIVSPEVNNFNLIRNAGMVAVITGTAAFEAIQLKIPTLVIGASPYSCIINSVTSEPSLASLPKAIAEGLRSPKPSDDHIQLYLASILSQSFRMNLDFIWGRYTDKPLADRIKVSAAIASWINRRRLESLSSNSSLINSSSDPL